MYIFFFNWPSFFCFAIFQLCYPAPASGHLPVLLLPHRLHLHHHHPHPQNRAHGSLHLGLQPNVRSPNISLKTQNHKRIIWRQVIRTNSSSEPRWVCPLGSHWPMLAWSWSGSGLTAKIWFPPLTHICTWAWRLDFLSNQKKSNIGK